MNKILPQNIDITMISIEDRVGRALSLDLSPIMFKLAQGDEKSPISRDTVEQVEKEYKRFLCLHLISTFPILDSAQRGYSQARRRRHVNCLLSPAKH